MKDPLGEIVDRIRRKEEIVAGLAGRTIEAATLAGDESDGADVERLILTFSDGGRVS